MKRRDFVKTTGLTALGLSVLGTQDSFANDNTTHLESDDLSPSAKADENFPINFIAVGDWGRNGEYDQQEVAKQMGAWARKNSNDFIIATGDNFYPRGVVSEHDPLWNFSFENIYTAHKLQCDWYAVLGNHDYGSGPDAQVRYSKISRRWKMPALYYTKEVNLGNPENEKALFVMIDTDPMLFEDKKEYVNKQMAWLEHTLANASAKVKWKIVVGHHPAYTVGPRIKNYDTLTARKMLTDVFNKHKVDLYLSGHDHSLQHLKPIGFTHQFISGAGSELTPVTTGIPYSRFETSENGFMYFSVIANAIRVKAINVAGKVVYETQLSK
ncbi:metallophosphoesterase [Mucilaginibacter myungsuensis]|uniref:acid phosphatase n=1 Tax=Mucilaginibacter myungsuensis TaxID=649104 RepID=A0A929L3D2_9SPHI|nr:metallophosphoesterase [Mucilaginibacter myungsuensis]MBE9663719.1 metallophosphoesterase [Mucilaginibacter myungsuensis]MDN3598957.1 metallophosphoesterase [Mucilaginibacter myungsuensis]